MRELGRVKQAARAATWTGTSVGARACACGKQSSGGEQP
jgi:hypothetical protein